MKSTFKHQRLCCLTLLAVGGFLGCQQRPPEVLSTAVVVPTELTNDGTVLEKEKMGPEQERAFTQFFRDQHEIMDSPEYEGYPSVFVS